MSKLVVQPPQYAHLHLEADQTLSLLCTPGADGLAGSPRLTSLANCTAASCFQLYKEAVFNYLAHHVSL